VYLEPGPFSTFIAVRLVFLYIVMSPPRVVLPLLPLMPRPHFSNSSPPSTFFSFMLEFFESEVVRIGLSTRFFCPTPPSSVHAISVHSLRSFPPPAIVRFSSFSLMILGFFESQALLFIFRLFRLATIVRVSPGAALLRASTFPESGSSSAILR